MGDCSGGLVWVGTSVAWLTEAAYLGWRAGERVPDLFQLLEGGIIINIIEGGLASNNTAGRDCIDGS